MPLLEGDFKLCGILKIMEFMLEAVKGSKFIPVKQKIPSVKLASLLTEEK